MGLWSRIFGSGTTVKDKSARRGATKYVSMEDAFTNAGAPAREALREEESKMSLEIDNDLATSIATTPHLVHRVQILRYFIKSQEMLKSQAKILEAWVGKAGELQARVKELEDRLASGRNLIL
jgi:hypothetical protein